MRIIVLTIFPEIFSSFLAASLIAKAIDRKLLSVELINIRDFAAAPHYKVDDVPYGGGAGMVMKPEPLVGAIRAARAKLPQAKVIVMSPRGAVFSQPTAHSLAREAELILVCGRYEGIDERVLEHFVDAEISIGDFVLMGGELPAMVLIESTVRLIPEVLGNSASVSHESFSASDSSGLTLEGPQYTRPPEYEGHQVPDILLSGDHSKIATWRHSEALKVTASRRPDLLQVKDKS